MEPTGPPPRTLDQHRPRCLPRRLPSRSQEKGTREPSNDRTGPRPPTQPGAHLRASYREGHRDTRGRVEARRQVREAVAGVAHHLRVSPHRRTPVDKITTADVMACLVPIWHTRPETARRVRQRIGAVMRWAIAQGFRADNPAGDAIAAALPSNSGRRQHHRALPHADVAASIATIRASAAYPTTALAFEFLVLTACRSGEVRGARWMSWT